MYSAGSLTNSFISLSSSACQESTGTPTSSNSLRMACPKVLVTTSRDPSSKLVQFLKEVKLLVPNSQRMNRGGHTVNEIVEMCRGEGYSDLVVGTSLRLSF